MKTSPIFSNSSEPEAGILQASQPQVLGATVGSSLDSRILKSKHLNWSWKGREPFFNCNNAFKACWLRIVLYCHTKTTLFRRNEFLRCQPHQGHQRRWLPIQKTQALKIQTIFAAGTTISSTRASEVNNVRVGAPQNLLAELNKNLQFQLAQNSNEWFVSIFW